MEQADIRTPAPDRRKDGTGPTVAFRPTTLREKDKMTADTVVRMIWDHHENHETRFNTKLVSLTTKSVVA
jgi:hypothetical protein